MKYETMLERFLGYVNFKSRSDASSTTLPSTPEQKDFRYQQIQINHMIK